ncbi:DUF4383 domain-containing protein [Nocardia transvalensis]|uniref:DUF4383 domain-containing protein n=1 Tax=Nocardia transvalensis TaxID=37333 RepID=UPI0018932660|nr:DUF4383 domain-containing protein [Nocardia transvalensis]MBF6329708.1 DUF4383 domain-containing protein [Nocardia transvalensis]
MATFDTQATRRSLVQYGSLAVGTLFLLVGVLGFIPGITTDYDTLVWAGHHTDAKLLGLFQVSALHNIVHLAFGVAGLVASRTALWSRGFLIGGGVVYLVLWIYGLVIDRASDANFVPVNNADNWLHLVLGAGMIALGLFLPRLAVAQTNASMHPRAGGPPGQF